MPDCEMLNEHSLLGLLRGRLGSDAITGSSAVTLTNGSSVQQRGRARTNSWKPNPDKFKLEIRHQFLAAQVLN